MRVQKRSPWLNGLGVAVAAMALWGAQAQADVSSDKPGSVVIWPKVIADGTRDTIITLSNTSNMQAYAHCEYVQALGLCSVQDPPGTLTFCQPGSTPGAPGACPAIPGNVCVPQWQSADFDVALTRQQPTMWRVSTGRIWDPTLPADGECILDPPLGPQDPARQRCPGIFEIGQVPPAPDQPFRGELRCIQVNQDGSESGANSLKGEATIQALESDVPQISTYNSVNIEALSASDDGIIELNDVEYSACPEAVEVSHYASGAQSLAADIDDSICDGVDGCPVYSEITVVPCRADFIMEVGAVVPLQIVYTNEFEQAISAATLLDCWGNYDLRDLGFVPTGSDFLRTRITPSGSGRCILGNVNAVCSDDDDCGAGGVCGPVSGVLAIVEEFHNTAASLLDEGAPGTAASNAYLVDLASDGGGLGREGVCRVGRERCESDGECPSGLCRFSGAPCADDVACGAGDFCDLCMNDEITFEADPIVTQLQ